MKRAKNQSDKGQQDPRPTIPRRDLERQVAEAGREAVEKANGLPGEPKVLAALAGMERPVVIDGITVARPALNALVAWERWLGSPEAKTASPTTMLATTAFVYLKPDEAIDAMNDEGYEGLQRAVYAFSRHLKADVLHAVTEMIRKHIGEVYGEPAAPEDGSKKKPRKP